MVNSLLGRLDWMLGSGEVVFECPFPSAMSTIDGSTDFSHALIVQR